MPYSIIATESSIMPYFKQILAEKDTWTHFLTRMTYLHIKMYARLKMDIFLADKDPVCMEYCDLLNDVRKKFKAVTHANFLQTGSQNYLAEMFEFFWFLWGARNLSFHLIKNSQTAIVTYFTPEPTLFVRFYMNFSEFSTPTPLLFRFSLQEGKEGCTSVVAE